MRLRRWWFLTVLRRLGRRGMGSLRLGVVMVEVVKGVVRGVVVVLGMVVVVLGRKGEKRRLR